MYIHLKIILFYTIGSVYKDFDGFWRVAICVRTFKFFLLLFKLYQKFSKFSKTDCSKNEHKLE